MARISDRTFRIVAGAALASLCTIVLTGALVRLTGSGLGCSDWPNCNETRFVDVSSGHTLIEQANRLFTGVVSASVIAAVLLAHLRRPARRDLVLLAWGLVLGVLAQIVIGGVVVLTGLNPWANMAHFLVSMLLVLCAFVLWRRSAVPASTPWWRTVDLERAWMVRLLFLAGCAAIVTGTVVTATGPHAGSEDAVRFGFALVSVARVHSIVVITTVSILVMLSIEARRRGSALVEPLQSVLFAALLQGAVGYLQYFTGVPVVLVAAHIAGATAFWLSLCNLLTSDPDPVG